MRTEPSRFREPDESGWLDPVFVVCPRCGKRATATGTKWNARLVCPACALTRTHSSKEWREVQGQDSRFGLPLWLRADCCGGHLLWANNGVSRQPPTMRAGVTLGPMSGPALRRFWRSYRHNYAEEQARRQAREQEQPQTTARTGFWLTFGLAMLLNLTDAVADPAGAAWTALRAVVGIAWTVFAVWYLVELLARRRARTAREQVPFSAETRR